VIRATFNALALLALWATPVQSIGPPTKVNTLNLFTRYEIGWLNPQTGEFGANVTFFRAVNAPVVNGWGLVFKYPNIKTTIDAYEGKDQWMVARDNSGIIVAMNKDENAPDPFIPADLIASDKARGLKRFNLFFNGKLTAPAVITDLTPTGYSLMIPGQARSVVLTDQLDYQNIPVTGEVRRAPFGPFATNGSGAGVAAASSDAPDPDNPSPKGQNLATAPIGLGIYLFILLMAGGAFTVGTIERFKHAAAFRKQRTVGGPPVSSAGPTKNSFLNK